MCVSRAEITQQITHAGGEKLPPRFAAGLKHKQSGLIHHFPHSTHSPSAVIFHLSSVRRERERALFADGEKNRISPRNKSERSSHLPLPSSAESASVHLPVAQKLCLCTPSSVSDLVSTALYAYR